MGARAHPWLLAGLAFLPVAVLRAATLAESDTFWQIRTGLLMIDERRLPATDPFSWTVPGRPWTLNSWWFKVVVAAVYRAAGLAGVAAACGVLVMVTAGLVVTAAVSLDSRNDLYGVATVLAAKRVLAGTGDPDPALAGAGCALVPADSGLARHLGASGQWMRTAAGGELVLYVRR